MKMNFFFRNSAFQNIIGTATTFSAQDIFQINTRYPCELDPYLYHYYYHLQFVLTENIRKLRISIVTMIFHEIQYAMCIRWLSYFR